MEITRENTKNYTNWNTKKHFEMSMLIKIVTEVLLRFY